MLANVQSIGDRGGVNDQAQQLYEELYEMVHSAQKKMMFDNFYPHVGGVGDGGQVFKIVSFRRNCMKCSGLHRKKNMFVNPSMEWRWNGGSFHKHFLLEIAWNDLVSREKTY